MSSFSPLHTDEVRQEIIERVCNASGSTECAKCPLLGAAATRAASYDKLAVQLRGAALNARNEEESRANRLAADKAEGKEHAIVGAMIVAAERCSRGPNGTVAPSGDLVQDVADTCRTAAIQSAHGDEDKTRGEIIRVVHAYLV